jgi:Flp pilus assembly protein TadB
MKWVIAALLVIVPFTAQAYVGPGAGVGMIGSLLAVLGAFLLSIVGLILWPLRMLRKRRQAKHGRGAGETHEAQRSSS